MSSSGISSGSAVKQPYNHSNSSGSDESPDDGTVPSSRGSGGPRRSNRQRKMSADGAEAVANGVTEAEFIARAKDAFDKAARARSSAPSTIAPGGAHSSSSSSLPLSSLLPSAPLSVSSLAVAAALQGNQLHGIDTARTAHHSAADIKVSSNLPSAPSTDERSSGQRERHHRRGNHRHRRDHRSRSSSTSSSSSSDDELIQGHHSLYYNGQRIKPRRQWYLSAIRTVRARYASFGALFEDAKVSIARNRFEGEELSAVLDQLLIAHDHINDRVVTLDHVARVRTAINVAMELAVRRLEGIIRSDASGGDWSFASSLSLLKRANLGNDDLMRSVTLDVTRTRAVTKANSNSGRGNGNGGNDSSSSRSHRGHRQSRGRGRGGKGGDNNAKSSSNDKDGTK